MRTTLPALFFIIFCSMLLLLPVHPNNPNDEINNKQSVLQRDVQETNLLCRTQCSITLTKVLQNNLNHRNSDEIYAALQSLQEHHPQMVFVSWLNPSQNFEEAIKVGELQQGLKKISYPLQKEAIYFLKKPYREKVYQSPSFLYDKDEYFVLGVSNDDQGPYIIGLVQQKLLKQIAVEQRKNLRIVPYPSDKRFKIQSVDAESLDDVDVRSPEDNEGVSHYHNHQVVVKFKEDPSHQQLDQIKKEIHALEIKNLGYTYVFESNQLNAKQMMDYFQKWNINYAEPHFLYLTNNTSLKEEIFIPNDSLFQQYQWNLPMIETLQGWDLSKGSEDVIVAVIDTGVDLDHPDLENQLVEGYNVINEQNLPYDDVGHGTHVAGIISASINNTEGIAGMSWYNKVMPVKALDHTGAGSTYSVAQGIIWAVDHGAKVINMSLGNYVDSEFLHDAIRYAFDRDVVLVSATGNDNTEDPGYPAAYEEVLAVSATNAQQKFASFSNYGNYVDVTAPGEQIASTYPQGQYAGLSGTSMASPHVAALAAMIRTANPLLKNTEIMEVLRLTSLDLGGKGRDPYYGFGQIDVVKALQYTINTNSSLISWSDYLTRELNQIDLKYAM